MQTPTGKSTRWRMNLSTIIAGSLQSGSQDVPALGSETQAMRYRPSLLPSPRQRPGVFVVRSGSEQLLVQAPYLAEDAFDALCAGLPRNQDSPRAAPDLDGYSPRRYGEYQARVAAVQAMIDAANGGA